jgi:fructose-bisphosphate aldolase, class II
MTRTKAAKLVSKADETSSAVGAFNVILLEHAEALVEGAERSNNPVTTTVP